MRVLKFPAYEVNEKRATNAIARAWIILFQAANGLPCGDRAQTATLTKTIDALKEASEVANPDQPDEEDRFRLKSGGAETYLEDAEWRLLEKAVEKYRETVRGNNADALALVDALIEKAPTVSKQKFLELSRRAATPKASEG